MDIPKQPIPPSSSKVSATESITPVKSPARAGTTTSSNTNSNFQRVPLSNLPSIASNAVPLDALALPVGEQVAAKVVGELKENALIVGKDVELPRKDQPPKKLASLEEALKTPERFQNNPNEARQQGAPKEWLLQIGNKYLVVETASNLDSGKLLAVTLNSQGGIAVTNPAAAADAQPKDQIENLLRQAITRALPQQTSLSSGFNSLTNASEIPSGQARPVSSAQLIAKLIIVLTQERIPNSDTLAQLYKSLAAAMLSNKSQSMSPAQSNDLQNTVESWIKSSGIMFEATQLVQLSTSIKALKTQSTDLAIIWKAISLADQSGAKSSENLIRAADAMLNYLNAQQAGFADSGAKIGQLLQALDSAQAPGKITDTLQGYQRALQAINSSAETIMKVFRSIGNAPEILSNERMQLSLEQALTNYTNYSQKALSSLSQLAAQLSTYSPKNSGTSQDINTQAFFEVALQQLPLTHSIPPDLKALLQSVALGLKAALSDTNTSNLAGESKLDLRGSLETTLLNKPFDFPQFDKSVLKAQAMLADQELTTGQMLKLIAGMLNRIQFNQANSLLQAQANADSGTTQSWNMELPYFHEQQIQTLQLRIDQHQAKHSKSNEEQPDQQRSWTIELSFDFEGIGPLHIKAELAPPKLKTEIWVANNEVKTIVAGEQALFIKRLQEAGLEVEPPTCHIGAPERKHKAHIKQGLVDIHA
ncbi:hypothetical protein A3742_09150 [Oleiphilus sp. HI0071]|uniref:flagellar hook-length control protein FliK n=1 Tax=Oleiphilus sp. HI0080 TaxID=1822255 RepID=UPI0007C317E1|nr:flagellar hook-length control protein FliK [Oleiphilus sp. HI0080]KZY60201.1 hypothetical protein A3737_07235 [Oleiphilus sp. HI0065]KZY82513.1 hypothetical protein A3742_09150 [Oleiphilus sp. HI0071]KZY92852.1 hypothetical protein A3744_14345 [Oleiphilus sp. HI0073]KZZ44782.1 hypothetical protein A3758_02180 [Oleiphilus sp. HI0118]KZZ49687.1 hypothetical protein A3760_14940 [Oleiphilus sp. HI0122]KZZ75918.1 hypothetical protein A3765_10200 [Oleiphilus sp. HI0130]KZZ78834.1 hypothetical p